MGTPVTWLGSVCRNVFPEDMETHGGRWSLELVSKWYSRTSFNWKKNGWHTSEWKAWSYYSRAGLVWILAESPMSKADDTLFSRSMEVLHWSTWCVAFKSSPGLLGDFTWLGNLQFLNTRFHGSNWRSLSLSLYKLTLKLTKKLGLALLSWAHKDECKFTFVVPGDTIIFTWWPCFTSSCI